MGVGLIGRRGVERLRSEDIGVGYFDCMYEIVGLTSGSQGFIHAW